MKQMNIAAMVLMMAVCSAGAEEMNFDGGTSGLNFFQALQAAEVPAATGCSQPAAEGRTSPSVLFEIRDSFYGTNSMAAFDIGSGYKITAYKYGNDWKTEVRVGDYIETGKAVSYQGKRFTYVSGDTAITLESRNGSYVLTGNVSAELAGGSPFTLDAKPAALNGAEAFTLKTETGDLAFSRASVRGRTANPRLAGALTALYLVALREGSYGVFRSVDFKVRGDIDENGGGWASCSNTSENWTINDVEWKTVSHSHQEIYVCKVEVTWSCRWRNCSEPYPHTQPGQCYCKAACSKSSKTTNQCEWQQVE